MNPHFLIFFGAFIHLLFCSRYIYLTLSGKIQPNRMTWLIWALVPMIAFFAMIADGFHISAIPVFMSGFIPFLIFLSSFINKKAYWKLERFDYACGTLSILALVLWGITSLPIIAIVLAIVSDALALLPTLKKAWKFPESENSVAFFGGLTSALIGLFVVEEYTFSSTAFLIYLLFACITSISVIERKKFS